MSRYRKVYPRVWGDAKFKRDGAGMTTRWKMRYSRQLTAAEIAERAKALAADGNGSHDNDPIPF